MDYLHLSEVLGAQHPLSDQPDEMMFIVIHQATEFWLKLAMFESARRRTGSPQTISARIQGAGTGRQDPTRADRSWQVLATMTPADYLTFRSLFGTASGLQSVQYRESSSCSAAVTANISTPMTKRRATRLESTLEEPSLYDEALLLLRRRSLLQSLDREWSAERVRSDDVTDVLARGHRKPDEHWDLYELAEKLVDLEHAFSRWRYEHSGPSIASSATTRIRRHLRARISQAGTRLHLLPRRLSDVSTELKPPRARRRPSRFADEPRPPQPGRAMSEASPTQPGGFTARPAPPRFGSTRPVPSRETKTMSETRHIGTAYLPFFFFFFFFFFKKKKKKKKIQT